MSSWNGNRFSVYTSEEKSVLGLIKEMGDQTNYNTDEIVRLNESDNKKVSHQEMQDKYKMDSNADFKGSWFGIKRPSASNVGLAATVNNLTDNVIPLIEDDIELLKENSASISYVDGKIGSLGNTRTFKGSCNYSALPSNANVDDYWFVIDRSSNFCWNGSSWIDIGNSLNIGNNTIGIEKLNFTLKSKNLFNKNTVTKGKYYNGNTALSTDSTGQWCVSDYIEVDPGVQMIKNNKQYACYYREKSESSAISINGDPWNLLNPPTGAKYVRVNVKINELESFMLVTGVILPTDYVPFYHLVDGEKIKYPFDENMMKDLKIKYKNIFDGKYTDGYYVNNITGELSENSSYVATDFIPVDPGKSYIKTGKGYLAYYGIDKKFISGNVEPWENIKTPSNCYYIRDSINKNNGDLDKYMIVEGTNLPEIYIPHTPYLYYKNQEISSKITDKTDKPYTDLVITSYGDSLVQNGGWQDYLVQELGCTHINNGCGGTTMTNRNTSFYFYPDGRYAGTQPVDGASLKESSIGNDDRINLIPSNTNILLVQFSTNDLHQNKPIGSWNDTDNYTFKGAMKYLAKKLRSRLPLCKIIFMTPTCERTDFVNSLGLKKIDYVKAIKESEDQINVPVIDLWSKTSFSMENFFNYSIDDIHWNSLGKKKIGEIVVGYLRNERPI